MTGSPETILVVDDNEAGRYVTARILRRAGFRVLEAATGQDALDLVASERPQLAVLDVNLPDISGIEVCRRIKQGADTGSVLVLQVSATNIATVDRVNALNAGADSFMIEPIEQEELVAVTRALLRLHRAEETLKTSLAQKEMLLRELNHRVKNNMQIISSMLHMQASGVADPTVRQKLEDMQNRVFTLAAVHEQLYRTADVAEINFREFGESLIQQIRSLHEERLQVIRLSVSLQPVLVPPDTAIHLGLIVNELLSNSFKHAFPDGRAGSITVSLDHVGENRIRLRIADDGRGLPDADNAAKASLGLRLVRAMAEQLSADLSIEGVGGTAVSLVLTLHPDAA